MIDEVMQLTAVCCGVQDPSAKSLLVSASIVIPQPSAILFPQNVIFPTATSNFDDHTSGLPGERTCPGIICCDR
jgi:hypothetical protein